MESRIRLVFGFPFLMHLIRYLQATSFQTSFFSNKTRAITKLKNNMPGAANKMA
jgi:hypothetical protein